MTVSDHDELRTLLQRYARAADDRNVDALRALFHPEATIQGARGAQSLDEWLAVMAEPSPFASSMHLIGEPLIELDGDRGITDTYASVTMGNAEMMLGIRYQDDVERVDGHWVFRRRNASTVWMKQG